jgi:hypothetical protein
MSEPGRDMSKERAMKRTLISYKAKPQLADRNTELVSAVFAELKAAGPDGVRYLTLRLEDDTFIHFFRGHGRGRLEPDPQTQDVSGVPGRHPRPLRRAAAVS